MACLLSAHINRGWARPFQYESLQGDQLRLLELLPDEKEGAETLHFSLKTYPRAEAPDYVALSYTWGEGQKSELIYLNGSRFFVMPNLREFFAHMFPYREEWRYMWIDAISINQSDLSERTEQVRRMGWTFGNATAVVAWLGADNDVDVGYMNAFTKAQQKWKDGWRGTKTDMEPGLCAILKRWSRSKPWDLPGMSPKALESLLRRPYRERTWIIQELRRAKKVDFLWGRSRFDWRDFVP